MRILRRTCAILAAAMIVAGITFGFAETSSAQTVAPTRSGQRAAAQPQAAGGTIDASTDRASSPPARGIEHEGNRSPSLFGAVEILKNLVIVAIIVALVALATRVTRGRRPTGGARRAGATANTAN